MVSTAGFKSRLRTFYVESASSPHVCMGSFQVPPTVQKHVWVGSDCVSNLAVRVNGCWCVGPVTVWQSVRGVPSLSPSGSWDRLQPHSDPELDEWKKMDSLLD